MILIQDNSAEHLKYDCKATLISLSIMRATHDPMYHILWTFQSIISWCLKVLLENMEKCRVWVI